MRHCDHESTASALLTRGSLRQVPQDVGTEMSFTEIVVSKKVQLKNAILLEGLPGVGNVGKLATAHLIAELGATKCTEIYSSHFPPQVLIEESGEVRLVNNELFYWRGKKDARDLLFLTGEYQG